MAKNGLTKYRYDEFRKEEKRRSQGRGSSKGTPKKYNGTASQAYMVDDNSAHKLATRYETQRSRSVRKGR